MATKIWHKPVVLNHFGISCSCGWQYGVPTQHQDDTHLEDFLLDIFNEHKKGE